MCGFGGIIHWDGQPVLQEDLDRMAFLLKHRGPDEWGVTFPTQGVGLSHCRLKVIDLSEAARQPMPNQEKTIWLVFNGEIYNFKELRCELESRGVSFRSQSDTEVILHAYEVWGREAIPRLDGMFALALWDTRRRELLLARDRTGKKPLYYWTDGRCVVFGSEIKGLLAHSHVPRRLDEGALAHLLAFGYPPSGGTCYDQIRQVPPASFILLQPEGRVPTPKPYWSLPSLDPRAGRPTIHEAEDKLKQLLTAAVRRRLIADVPLGAFLSGGLDSTLVVGLMARLSPDRPVKTFSIGFEGDARFDETSFAQIAAKRFDTEHTVFTVTPQSFELLERLVWHHEQPFGDSSAIPTYLLSQLTRSHVTVALNGDGGDELFAGYDRFQASLLSERLPPGIRKLGAQVLGSLTPGADSRSGWGRARRFFEGAQKPLGERFFLWTSIFPNPGDLLLKGRGIDPKTFYRAYTQALEITPDGSLLGRLLSLNFHEYLSNDLNVKMDRCSMAHGLETRSPFLDTALIEWAFGLPDSFKLRGRQTKWIVRQAFRDLIPPAIQHRGKMGFGVPLAAWFRGRWREPLQDLLGSPQSRLYRYMDPQPVQRLIHHHLHGVQDAGHQLWLLLTLEVWLRQMEHPIVHEVATS